MTPEEVKALSFKLLTERNALRQQAIRRYSARSCRSIADWSGAIALNSLRCGLKGRRDSIRKRECRVMSDTAALDADLQTRACRPHAQILTPICELAAVH